MTYFRWCLFPTHASKDLLKPSSGEGWKHRDEAVVWFTHVYPRTQLPSWPKDLKPVILIVIHIYDFFCCNL